MRAGEAREEARAYKRALLNRMFTATTITSARDGLDAVVPAGSNILGVGYGVKMVGDTATEDPAVRVYVRSKLAVARLSASERIPTHIDDRPTDVIEVHDLSARARPVCGGASIGHVDITAGTLGCLVHDAGDPGTRSILSNNHVLANSDAGELGDPILQPGPLDGGDPDDPIALLTAVVPLRLDGTANRVDAAIARPIDPSDVLPAIGDIGEPVLPPVDAALYQSVRKHGRTTGHTVGVIVDVAADIRVRFGTRIGLFEDQLAIVGIGDGFSAGGDSGSLIVDAVRRNPVALLFAGGGATTFGNPIGDVLDALGVCVVGSAAEGDAGPGPATSPDADDPEPDLRSVKDHARERFGGLDGVQGFGLGDRCLRIYIRTSAVAAALPDTFEGVPVECITVGDIVADDG